MNVEAETRGLVALRTGGRVPEMLGNFHLDDHNVEEWSDATEPGLRHRARKEVGKWVDPERNADIQYQKREDSKKSDRGQENERTEVIQGTAPDSAFQIVRSHRQVHDLNEDTGGSRFSTTSTSYQMSSSRGIRSSSKTTSNKTTTKTVTLSGRSDDFENLKMSLQPLDTSAQRERISMGRSGTLGVRRPPTRRHNAPPPNPASPTPGVDIEEEEEAVDTENHTRNNHSFPGSKLGILNDPADYAIVGYKNLSPKIRVGFPVEIQLELQTKLRANSSTTFLPSAVNGEEVRSKPSVINTAELMGGASTRTEIGAFEMSKRDEMTELEESPPQSPKLYEPEQNQRRKSYGFESFDSHSHQLSKPRSPSASRSPTPQRTTPNIPIPTSTEQSSRSNKSLFSNSDTISYSENFTPANLSRSWDLIQSAANSASQAQQRRSNANKRQLFPSSSATNLLSEPNYLGSSLKLSGTRFEEQEARDNYRLDSLEAGLPPRLLSPEVPDNPLPDPDSPSSARSRKLMKLLDETPTILNSTYFKSNLSPESQGGSKSSKSGSESKLLGSEAEWDRSKRQLSFLNESLSRFLEGNERKDAHESSQNQRNPESQSHRRASTDDSKSFYQKTMGILSNNAEAMEGYSSIYNNNNSSDLDLNYHSQLLKQTQVSQTWISGGDMQKPSQHARDQDVTTSISATNDPVRKPSRKVEFCKTEVHFTPESGKFHIVETDENKPSTVHLFRRKKRSERKTIEVLRSDLLGATNSNSGEVETIVLSGLRNPVPEWKPVQSERDMSEADRNITDLVNHEIDQLLNEETLIEPSKPFLTPPPIERRADERTEKKRLDLDLDAEEDDSEAHLILNNYGELKIQRYLRQLRSQNGSESSEESLDPELGPDHEPREGETHFRFDNAFHYDHGSFVPLATRRSLIEMNNRNRKRTNHAAPSHVSDNSSTTSNYSLPHSDHSKDFQPLKLTAMEATVATTGAKPKITSVELRYSVEDGDYGRATRGKTFMTEPVMVTSRYDDSSQQQHHTRLGSEERRVRSSRIPSPVMPSDLRSMPPYRNGRHSFNSSPTHSPTRSPSRENPAFRNPPKPPTPILPIQFSTFEKTGAALRERFYTKNPKCVCRGPADEANPENQTFTAIVSHTQESSARPIPSKSLVNIGQSEEDLDDVGDEPSKSFSAVLTSSKQLRESSEEASPPHKSLGGIEHTWKDNDGDDYENEDTSPKTPSVVRSMTFPKTSRPEPEWVSKARAKAQSRVTDWTLIGKQYGPSRNTEPPWMSELRTKNKHSPSEELKSMPKVSIVYPWQNEKSFNCEDKNNDDSYIIRPETGLNPKIQVNENTRNKIGGINPPRTNGKVTSFKSITSLSPSPANNKSIVDLNRDSDSILINPPQIELDAGEALKTDRHQRQRRIQSASPQPNGSSMGSKRSVDRMNQNQSDPRSATPTRNGTHKLSTGGRHNKEKRSKTPENYADETQSIRKPLQTSTSTNKVSMTSNPTTPNDGSGKAIVGSKPKAPPKPPKPPQRISSLVKSQTTTTFNASLEKKKKATPTTRKVINHTNNSADSLIDETSRNNTPIHRHPTVQVSKLPIRSGTNSKTSSNDDGRNMESKSKTKTHVSLISEAKRMCKGTIVDGSLSSHKTSSSPLSNSPSSGGMSPSPKTSRRSQVIIPPVHKKR